MLTYRKFCGMTLAPQKVLWNDSCPTEGLVEWNDAYHTESCGMTLVPQKVLWNDGCPKENLVE